MPNSISKVCLHRMQGCLVNIFPLGYPVEIDFVCERTRKSISRYFSWFRKLNGELCFV